MAFFGATVFFAAVGPCRVMSLEKKKKKFQLKKRQRFRKNHRRGHRTRTRARISITPQTFGTEEVYYYIIGYKYKAITWYLNGFPNGSDLGSTV